MKNPKNINGPKGIAVLKVIFLEKRYKIMPMSEPIQKLSIKPTADCIQPKKTPKAKAIFASPKPIHWPLETNQITAKKRKSTAPEARCKRIFVKPATEFPISKFQFPNKSQILYSKIKNKKAAAIAEYTNFGGRILCLKSYKEAANNRYQKRITNNELRIKNNEN